jgi:hypothetical protein
MIDGATIADPFRPTAELVDLLHRRAAQLAPITRPGDARSGVNGRRSRRSRSSDRIPVTG